MKGGGAEAFGEPRRIATNFGWLVSDRTGRVAVSLLVNVLVARHLGPTEFGVLNFATALTALFAVGAGLGLETVVVRDLVRGDKPAVWRAAWQLRWVAAAAAYGLTVCAAWAWRPDSPRLWGVVAIVAAGLLFAPADLIDAWFQSKAQMRPPALARQMALWAAAAWRLALVAWGASLEAFALAQVLEAAAIAGALRWVFRRAHSTAAATEDVAGQRRRILRESWPLLASGVLVTLTMQADRLLLGHFRGDEELGVYAVAARLTEIFHMIPVALGAAVMPRFTALHQEARVDYWVFARRMFAGVIAAACGIAASLAWAGPRLVEALFGEHYRDAASVLVVHAWSLIFVFVVSLRSRLLVIEAGSRWVWAMSLLTAAVNVGGNLVLIPRLGGVGAAWAAVGAWAFSALAAPMFFAPTRAHTFNVCGAKPHREAHG